ncbi:exodeoxyribonuclease III [candidate division WOR-3 bacterium]|nr:exodeoxyribonuclease III [candidate division WOR-3 bacterium]
MPVKRLLSWNVNGIRAIMKKGLMEWLNRPQTDIVCLQETKAHYEQIPDELKMISGMTGYFASAERKGYSGVALFAREVPLKIAYGFGIPEFDREGRVIIADFGPFIVYNVYFPNGKMSEDRLKFKMAFYDAFLVHVDEQKRRGHAIVVCGDVNTAHKEIDLSHPKENAKTSGFLPIERAWIDTFIDHGYIDTFRVFNKEGGHYTWWDYKSRARDRNIGWRIDYFFVSKDLKPVLKKAFIESSVLGSDHCPIGIELKVP